LEVFDKPGYRQSAHLLQTCTVEHAPPPVDFLPVPISGRRLSLANGHFTDRSKTAFLNDAKYAKAIVGVQKRKKAHFQGLSGCQPNQYGRQQLLK
jgi:hypothetical protein